MLLQKPFQKHCTARTTRIIHAKLHPIRLCSDHSPAEMGFGTTRDLMRGVKELTGRPRWRGGNFRKNGFDFV
jgi:hypothetical protein